MALVGIGVWTYNRLAKKYKHFPKTPASINGVQNGPEAVIPSQTLLPPKRTRTKVTPGMVRKWDMAAKKGMSRKQIAAKYGVALVSVDRHLALMNRKREPKTGKMPGTGTKATNYKS